MHQDRNVRVRLLGPLRVVRADGSEVAADEWRTGKTMDLLRLLALSAGNPVRPESLVEKLWPDVASQRGRGSLRTASSQIRRAVRSPSVQRQPQGLLLRDAWVDVVAFEDEARRLAVAAREGRHEEVLALAHRAEELYVDDFHAHADDSDWAVAERQHLVRVRLDLLTDAASSAQALRRHREAVELATAAIAIGRTSESAHRVLMRAYAALGDIANALRAFETYRHTLADELGVDPSPQTQELHLRLLRGESAS